MNDDERDITGLPSSEEDLAGRLTRLGPLMLEQERFEAEMDPAFARTLRAHLVYGEEQAPHPAFVRTLRARLLREKAARPVGGPIGRRLIGGVGAATVALVALLLGVLVAVLLPQQAHAPSFSAPYPTRADLIFSFPAPPTVIRRLLPTVSLVHPRSGIPFAGHLRLRAAHLPATPRTLRAYRLAPPSNVVTGGRRLLRIRSPMRQVVVGSTTWFVAADGGGRSGKPLHSLAVSRATGELIYHDRRNLALPRATSAAPRSVAVTAARRWLVRLGWPGNRMPLTGIEQVPHRPKVREVIFGWIGVGRTATAAATLWVTPDRSVIEAWVWPPVVQTGAIPVRSVAAAWDDARRGKLPLAVQGVSPSNRATGNGTVRSTSVVSILSLRRRGSAYLVPVYRFAGKAHIPGASIHSWYTLATGERK